MTPSQRAIEAAARALSIFQFGHDEAWQDHLQMAGCCLTAALAVDGVQGWQTIESAPKDGSWFMICRDEEGSGSYEVGRYEPMYFNKYQETETGSGLYRVVKERGNYDWRGFNNMHRATHWTTLLSPPAANDGEERSTPPEGKI